MLFSRRHLLKSAVTTTVSAVLTCRSAQAQDGHPSVAAANALHLGVNLGQVDVFTVTDAYFSPAPGRQEYLITAIQRAESHSSAIPAFSNKETKMAFSDMLKTFKDHPLEPPVLNAAFVTLLTTLRSTLQKSADKITGEEKAKEKASELRILSALNLGYRLGNAEAFAPYKQAGGWVLKQTLPDARGKVREASLPVFPLDVAAQWEGQGPERWGFALESARLYYYNELLGAKNFFADTNEFNSYLERNAPKPRRITGPIKNVPISLVTITLFKITPERIGPGATANLRVVIDRPAPKGGCRVDLVYDNTKGLGKSSNFKSFNTAITIPEGYKEASGEVVADTNIRELSEFVITAQLYNAYAANLTVVP